MAPMFENRRLANVQSVVITRLQEVDPAIPDEVDDAMLFGETARPRAGRQVLQRLGLPNTREGITEDRLHEVQTSQSHLPVGRHPEAQVVDELRVKDAQPLPLCLR